ncbi:TPA: hypothetical protein RQ837_001972 [Pseudomonas aeruginosa]|uniref:DUF6978 family protein n=3 Tax=Pseudomonas aeruginosa TaxID=287 RepID=UPI0001E9E6C0|nr:hypothetical protein [Pseudomonas aeruginosa]EFQ42188.1 hypothetical protein PA39016_003090044 [Pseudomonas aeruginosa 39016]EIU3573458.1 hypothetical protein [Pseudomonas aeruginosa]EIU3804002.1 hypothetical protein [Pseudomonas aeruginosa]EJK6089162.1 hypothetical protein [Pseudomonas aeruginosa]EKD5500163.1 hypothetical protein [Pseudomonas aeruginosa]
MSEIILTDEQIQYLLTIPKRTKTPNARWRVQKKSRQRNYDLESEDGSLQFSLYLRQNMRIVESFSCGLLYLHAGGEKVTLARYNGSDHPHNNPLDGTRADNHCHIHRATERYMAIGRKSEHYAESTDRYTDLSGALRAIVDDCMISGIRLANAMAADDNDEIDEPQLDLDLK